MTTKEEAQALLARLDAVLRPMDGAKVIVHDASLVRMSFERISGPEALQDLGESHLFHYAPSGNEARYLSEEAPVACVVEDDDYVFSCFGAVVGYDDEGCAGAIQIDAHVVPVEARPAKIAELVAALSERLPKKPPKRKR